MIASRLRPWWKTVGCCLLLAVAARAQDALTIGFQKRAQIAVSGATAAYSLDSIIADASASAGVVEVLGKSPGATNIIIVTPAGVQTLAVTVSPPVPILPPGFEGPRNEGAAGESGSYEFRYNSDPAQITNSLDMKRIEGDSFERLRLTNANLFSAASSQSIVGFPFLSYEISKPKRDLTFLDQQVVNSPFTLDNYIVRGFHLTDGPWQFHGGFTSIATFQGLFLATDREYVAGLSRTFVLDRNTSVETNLYYFRNPASAQQVSSNGPMGSVVYRIKRGDRIHFLAELGVSKGVGFAVRDSYDTERTHFLGSFRTESRNFASLAINTQHGTFTSLDATRKLSPRFYDALDISQSAYNLQTLQQKTFTLGDLVNFKLNRNLSFNGGINYSSFSSTVPAGPSISTANLPVSADYSTRHFGAGAGYQRTINFDGTGGNDYTVNLRAAAGEFHAGAFFRHDVQVPTLAAVFSQIPGLQDALERAGIVATTPDQLAALLNNAALLASLGFTTPLVVNLAPVRNDFEASLNWISRGRARRTADLSYFKSDTQLIQGRDVLTTLTLSYSQRLTQNDNIVGSAAMVHSDFNGAVNNRPLFSVSLQHRFFRVPGLLFPGRNGMIEGHVFRDDEANSTYAGQAGLGGVEVRLDDGRTTHTNSDGYYSFHHVPYGVHRIEARYENPEPFFYTTDSPATADINSTVDFGINFAKGQLFGYLKNDAGGGIGGVTVELRRVGLDEGAPAEKPRQSEAGAQTEKPAESQKPQAQTPQAQTPEERQAPKVAVGQTPFGLPPSAVEKEAEERGPRQTQTGDNGKFVFAGLSPGTYIISTVASSYPAGYSLQDAALAPHAVAVLPGKPGSLEITVKALRSLSGRVLLYDQKALQTVPFAGAFVRLKEIGLEAHAGDNGAYILRNVPAGTYTLVVSYLGKQTTRTVTVPPGPANLRNVDMNAGTK
jgi:hypothetical protein